MANAISDLRKQSEIDKFIDNLTDSEHAIIRGCYESTSNTFDWALQWAIDKNTVEYKKEIPILKRFAAFEKKYSVRLAGLLGLPKLAYEGHVFQLADSVRLPIARNENGDWSDIHIGLDEQRCLHGRDMFFNGSWDGLRRCAEEQKSLENPLVHLVSMDKLEQYEKKHGVDLGVLLRIYLPLVPISKGKKKQKVLKRRF